MSVEIGTEVSPFHFREYLNSNFFAVFVTVYNSIHKRFSKFDELANDESTAAAGIV
jgi:hypothetical protein